MSIDLSQRWHALAQQLGLRDAGQAGSELIARYAEPHRRFHGHAHLMHVLDLLDELDADPRLHLAAWFHDAIYRPGRGDNERRSAALARKHMTPCGLTPADVDFVVQAVLATADHDAANPTIDPLLDADLAVLGAKPQVYRIYRDAIRQEFAKFPALLYTPGRVRFLQSMLQRPAIFRTQACHLRLEAQARINLRQELDELTGGN
jgi:predicted metal-dependent HD superfamily phosphohydrolase